MQKKDYKIVFEALSTSPVVHPFTKNMTRYFLGSCQLLVDKYNADARNIWTPSLEAEKLINKLIEFPGIGVHKAKMGVFLLTIELGFTVYEDGSNLDISKVCNALAAMYTPFDQNFLSQKTLS